jgi:hypothetical protein|tara:strand:+ start:209 stop:571 length:363 start_codon:yes stop_codon:yes gene_type:complete
MSRPTKYTPEILAKAKEYLNCYETAVPSRQSLALYLDVALSTIDLWDKEHAEFSGTLRRIKYTQFEKTLDGGLRGELSASISKLIMHNHGYTDKVDTTSSDGSMTPPTIIKLVAKEFGDL